jgi:hypothetical protein
MASIIRDAVTQHWVGKAPSLSNARWLKRALGAARKRDRSISSYPASLKPTENVLTGRDEACCINAVMSEESTPPDRKLPSGTSLSIWDATTSESTVSRRRVASFGATESITRQPFWREKRVDPINVSLRLGFAGVNMDAKGVTRHARHPIPS